MQYFIYNSKQLAKIDAFASDNGIHVMIINTQAFNASLNEDKNKEGRAGDAAARIIFSRRDEFGSRKPIDILAKTNPILIIDEPQSVLGTDKGNATRKGIKLFTHSLPCCIVPHTVKYSTKYIASMPSMLITKSW